MLWWAGMENEEWLPITDYPYEVSSFGRVRRAMAFHQFPAGYVLKSKLDREGYPVVALSRQHRYRHVKVSVLVCIAFNGPRPSPRHHAAHWDGVKQNNIPSNLRWATPAENEMDKSRQGMRNDPIGEKHHAARLTDGLVRCMRLDRLKGELIPAIAAKYGFAKLTTYDAVIGKTWAHVIDPPGTGLSTGKKAVLDAGR